MSKILILGIGSPFADDQFGWCVADSIAQSLGQNSTISVEKADRPSLNLLQWLEQDYDNILLIDAVDADSTVGRHFYLSAHEIMTFSGFLSSHSIGLAPSLALANALNYPIQHIDFYGVQAERLRQKDNAMSPTVVAQVKPLVEKILSDLDKSQLSITDKPQKCL